MNIDYFQPLAEKGAYLGVNRRLRNLSMMQQEKEQTPEYTSIKYGKVEDPLAALMKAPEYVRPARSPYTLNDILNIENQTLKDYQQQVIENNKDTTGMLKKLRQDPNYFADTKSPTTFMSYPAIESNGFFGGVYKFKKDAAGKKIHINSDDVGIGSGDHLHIEVRDENMQKPKGYTMNDINKYGDLLYVPKLGMTLREAITSGKLPLSAAQKQGAYRPKTKTIHGGYDIAGYGVIINPKYENRFIGIERGNNPNGFGVYAKLKFIGDDGKKHTMIWGHLGNQRFNEVNAYYKPRFNNRG